MAEDFSGTWYNQHHSAMHLKLGAGGKVRGYYQTKVGAPGDEEQFDLVGFTTGDQISFTVNFGKYGSLTAWVGQLYRDPERNMAATIYTFWHLTKNVKDPDEKEQLWASILTGSDRFQRNKPEHAPAVVRIRPSHPLESSVDDKQEG